MTAPKNPEPPRCRDMAALSDALRPLAVEFLRQLSDMCVPHSLYCGQAETWRSAERQAWLFAQNDPDATPPIWKTNCDGVKNRSRHQTGDAMDFYIAARGSKAYLPRDHEAWAWADKIAAKLGLRTLKKEKGHVERRGRPLAQSSATASTGSAPKEGVK